MNLQAINKTIIFKFVDHVNTNGEFVPRARTSGLVLLASHENSAKLGRHAVVQHIGSSVTKVKEGDTILIPPLRWTNHINVNGTKMWKTDEAEICAIVNGDCITPLNDFIFVKPHDPIKPSPSGIYLITNDVVDNTPLWKVTESKCADINVGDTVACTDTHAAEISDVKLHFTKVDNVLMTISEE